MLKQFNLVSLLSDEEKEKDTNVAQYFVYLIMYIGLLLHLFGWFGLVIQDQLDLSITDYISYICFVSVLSHKRKILAKKQNGTARQNTNWLE